MPSKGFWFARSGTPGCDILPFRDSRRQRKTGVGTYCGTCAGVGLGHFSDSTPLATRARIACLTCSASFGQAATTPPRLGVDFGIRQVEPKHLSRPSPPGTRPDRLARVSVFKVLGEHRGHAVEQRQHITFSTLRDQPSTEGSDGYKVGLMIVRQITISNHRHSRWYEEGP